ncbi:spondin-1-like [Culicoides brevitarsis]|uniref:spondin-1-like n=1 Tax=Culicoides brevitarsis TaxID=469753 RepID=UPI00307B171C
MLASRHHHIVKQLIALLLLLFMIDNVQNTKSRTQQRPLCHFTSEIDPELRHSRALDKKYQIKLDNENIKYFIPGDTYTISISGVKPNQHFVSYYLTAEATVPSEANIEQTSTSTTSVNEGNNNNNNNKTYQNVGTFQLLSSTFGKFSEKCPNLILPSEMSPKRKIQVLWTAPRGEIECVTLKAAVMLPDKQTVSSKHHRAKQQQYGIVRKKLCRQPGLEYDDDEDEDDEEEENESDEDSFDKNDNKKPPILATCCACGEAKYELVFEGLWDNATATKTSSISFSDVIGASHSTDYALWNYGHHASNGLKYLMKQGASLKLESELKDQSEHIRTIIKARGISYPNVVGKSFAVFRVDSNHHLISLVSRLESRKEFSVGVSGFELCMKNCSWIIGDTINLYPWVERNGVIKRAKTQRDVKPIARLYITRQSLYDDDCEMVNDGKFQSDQAQQDEYNMFTYSERHKNDLETSDEDSEDEIDAEDDDECALTDWSEWTECNNSCGKGERSRSRKYKSNGDKCEKQHDTILQEIEECVGIDCPEDIKEYDTIEDEMCRTTGWSEWSPCSKSCGRGRKARYRSLLSQSNITSEKQSIEAIRSIERRCHHVNLVEERICGEDQPACEDRLYHPPRYCTRRPKAGFCRQKMPRWYYDKNLDDCEPFSFTGCGGNNNNFHSYDDCLKVCKSQQIKAPSTTS